MSGTSEEKCSSGGDDDPTLDNAQWQSAHGGSESVKADGMDTGDMSEGEAIVATASKHLDKSRYPPSSMAYKYIDLLTEPCGRLTREGGDREPYFGAMILVCIVFAGLLVGIQTYDFASCEDTKCCVAPDGTCGVDDTEDKDDCYVCSADDVTANNVVTGIDNTILLIFVLECIFKIFAEGTAPWKFFTGVEWKWNNFDFVIVVFCIPAAFGLELPFPPAVLRLFRLARLVKLVKKVPQLQMILMGLVGGLQSITYIVLLLFLIFYLFAIAGMSFWGRNDPWHFGNIPISLVTLFRAATLEDWTDIMYVNYFGCAEYAGIYFGWNESLTSAQQRDQLGGLRMFLCENAEQNPFVSAVYWIFFTMISALVVLSLFIGSVTMAMSEAMNEQKKEKELEEKAAEAVRRERKWQMEKDEAAALAAGGDAGEAGAAGDGGMSPFSRRLFGKKATPSGRPLSKQEKEERKKRAEMRNLLLAIVDGPNSGSGDGDGDEDVERSPLAAAYSRLAEKAEFIVEHKAFVNFVTIVILLAGCMVGIGTDNHIMNDHDWGFREEGDPADPDCDDGAEIGKTACGGHKGVMYFVELTILIIFIIELALKFIAEEFAPWRMFRSHWNKFDFVVVAGSFVPGVGSLATMLRLLRLLRVLKLLRSLPALAVIVNALIMGFSSIGFIGLILVAFFYLFAIMGVMSFKVNDPWHFGTLHLAMLSLFRVCTGDDWTDIMYINIYGCRRYPAGLYDQTYAGPRHEPFDCSQERLSWMAALFFIVFVLIGALVLLSLFIGTITTAMEEATTEQCAEKKLNHDIEQYVEEKALDHGVVDKYRAVFGMLDLDGGGTINEDELYTALTSVGSKVGHADCLKMLTEIDDDCSGEIDVFEWIKFVVLLNEKQRGTTDGGTGYGAAAADPESGAAGPGEGASGSGDGAQPK